jgi:hypothetical protein
LNAAWTAVVSSVPYRTDAPETVAEAEGEMEHVVELETAVMVPTYATPAAPAPTIPITLPTSKEESVTPETVNEVVVALILPVAYAASPLAPHDNGEPIMPFKSP